MKKLSVSTGFTTNSSSRVVHIPEEVLEDPDVQALLEKYEVEEGYVGDDMWHRAKCETIAITEEQKREVKDKLDNHGFDFSVSTPKVKTDSDEIVVVYGDEHNGIAQTLVALLAEKDVVRSTLAGASYN